MKRIANVRLQAHLYTDALRKAEPKEYFEMIEPVSKFWSYYATPLAFTCYLVILIPMTSKEWMFYSIPVLTLYILYLWKPLSQKETYKRVK